MKTRMNTTVGALAALAIGAAVPSTFASASAAERSTKPADARHGLVREATETLSTFEQTDPSLSRFLDSAVGYAVFPSVGKGGAGIGGAYGRGVLFEHGSPIGQATLTQVTIGLQLGGQSYSEILFFESEEAVARFKKGQLAMAAQASAVAAGAGTAANARYARGVAVFTLARRGLMAEASVGGQKFAFRPFADARRSAGG